MSELFLDEPSILKVNLLGHPVLRKRADPVTPKELKDPRFKLFIESMIETMREYNGAGLAAPQVGVSRQVAVVETQENPRYPGKESIPLTVLINPEITAFSPDVEEGWEGCLSVRDLWGKVKRATGITLKALSMDGKEVTIKVDGFQAVVFQHEIDHLYGKLFIDRMEGFQTLSFTQEYRRYWQED